MKGRIEVTIPQRQFENIKITYDFNNEEEYLSAKNKAVNECIDLHNIVGRKAKILEEEKINQSLTKSVPSDAWKAGTKLQTPTKEVFK